MKVTEIFDVSEAEANKLSESPEQSTDLVGWLPEQDQQIEEGKSRHKHEQYSL